MTDPFNTGPIDNRIDALINELEIEVLSLINISPKSYNGMSDKYRQNQINRTKRHISSLSNIRDELVKSIICAEYENKGAGR